MDAWVIGTYLGFIILMLVGVWSCWRSNLPTPQKGLWTFIIIVFPVAGTIFFYLFAQEAKDLFT